MKTWGVGWTKAGERGLYSGASCHKLEGPCWLHKPQPLVSACRSQEDAANKDRAWGRVHLGGTEDLLGPRDALWDQTVDSWKFSKLGHRRLNSPLYCCPVTKWCPTLFDPMNYSMPGFPILHHLPEFPQIHVHWVSDAIWPSHLLPPASPFAFNLFQHQGLFQSVGSSHQVPKVLELCISLSNDYSGLISFRIDWFGLLAV